MHCKIILYRYLIIIYNLYYFKINILKINEHIITLWVVIKCLYLYKKITLSLSNLFSLKIKMNHF